MPLVAVAVRSLCSDLSARRVVPILALAPYAIWVGVSMDGVVAALGAASLAVGVVGSEPGRKPVWAAVAGLLLGVAALFDYSVAWLGLSVLAVYFVRRRPLLNVISAARSLTPLLLMQIWGFVWPSGTVLGPPAVLPRRRGGPGLATLDLLGRPPAAHRVRALRSCWRFSGSA